uniref:Uridine diphosphate glucose pyrophosphatase NUDT14 n=1 Tax=Trichuris muris TaxID=70415 RepID=A0A5S6R4D6_TRIMR
MFLSSFCVDLLITKPYTFSRHVNSMEHHITRTGDIKNIRVEAMGSSEYIKPLRLHFEQLGKKRFWDAVLTHNCVSAVIYHRNRNTLVLVKQFRPAVYIHMAQMMGNHSETIDTIKYPISLGMTYELCAGIMDQILSPEETMVKEIKEEIGYSVQADRLERITGCRSGVGIAGYFSTYYYCEVNDSMKVSSGGGNPNELEFIEVVYVPVEELRYFMFDESRPKPPSLIFGILWFLQYKLPKLTGHKA